MKYFFTVLMINGLFALSTSFAQSLPIVMDGYYGDWSSSNFDYTDNTNEGGIVDFYDMSVANDDDFLYVRFRVNQEIDLTDNNVLTLHLDTDNNANTALPDGNSDFYFAYAERAYITKAMSLYANGESSQTEQQHLELWQSCLASLSETTQLDTPTLLGIRRHHSLPDAHFLLVWLYIEVAKGPMYIAAKQLGLDEVTLKLNINSIQLHHPEAYLRYIANSWQSNSKVA